MLDTHALLWWAGDDPRIGPQSRSLLRDRSNQVLVSVVSLWEIALKARVGKLASDLKEISEGLEQDGFSRLGITDSHLAALVGLPTHHKDPFDHLLIAQAVMEQATLMSEDRWMPSYPVSVVRCSA